MHHRTVWILSCDFYTFIYLNICLYVLIHSSTTLVTRLYTLESSGLPNLYSLEAVQWSYCFHLITSVLAIREKYSLYKYVNICSDIINNTITYHTTLWGIYLKNWKIKNCGRSFTALQIPRTWPRFIDIRPWFDYGLIHCT